MDEYCSDSDDVKQIAYRYNFMSKKISERHSWEMKPKNNMETAEIWCTDIQTTRVDRYRCWRTIKLHILWPYLFVQKKKHDRYLQWAIAAKFIDPENYDVFELNLIKLQDIEILEEVLHALRKQILSITFLTCLLDLWDKVDENDSDLDDAIAMIEKTEELTNLQVEVNSGTKYSRMAAIAIGCFQYAYFIKLFKCPENTPNLVPNRDGMSFQESESCREKGNKEFKKENYEAAVKWYSRAIDLCPVNEILYGNRALCFFRIEKYKKALGDGKRAIILKPDWTKGHYRFCDALFSMGEHKHAIEANNKAQELCKSDSDGIRDLIQQKSKFLKRLQDENLEKTKTDALKEELSTKKEQPQLSAQPLSECCKNESTRPLSEECHKNESKRNQERNGLKGRLSQWPKKMSMPLNSSDNLMDKLKSLIHAGHVALTDQRARNAEHAFLQILKLLDPEKLEEVSLSTIDYVIIIYGHACALLGIGLPEELTEAENQFNKILEQFPEQRLDCLAFYGLGKVYFQQNRFTNALDPFTKSLTMVNRKIVPGILTWPTTTVVIEETQNEKLKALLEEYIEKCQFPPQPDAICRYQYCHGHSKTQIYFSDPDFKGFIQVICVLQCRLEYHINCWKKLKAASFQDKNDKDFLKDPCFTPDCGGKISKIVIYDSKGLVKCEFEAKIMKNKESAKTVVKQKCSSALKLKIKEDRKQTRKLLKEASRYNAEKEIRENVEKNGRIEETNSKTGQSWNPFGDRMLQLIIKNKEKLKAGEWNVSNLLQELQSFRVLSKEDCDKLSIGASKPCQIMGQLLDLIVQKNNRVKTRAFLYTLTKCQEVDNKLLDWIKWLNDAGREAAGLFLLRYSKFLEQLDLDSLLNLLKASEIELPLFDSSKEIIEQLKQESPTKTRSFIWTLEEKREQFPSLHNPLDEYFNAMDAPCTVLKKQENEELSNTALKSKMRNRKKKPKDSKSVILLSEMFGSRTREEDDDEINSDDSNLVHMNSTDLYAHPDYLGQQREFEDMSANISDGSHYQRLLDNNPDPTRESLYDYFAQILNEHGPLEVNAPLLVGEFENFPPEAQELVQNKGGLKSFLMESLRFVMINNLIGLMKHAVQLESSTVNDKVATRSLEASKTNLVETSIESLRPVAHLNPAAKEFKPVSYSSILTSNINSLSEPQNQYLYDNELGDNISTDDGYVHINPYSDASQKVHKSTIILDHNVKTRDPMTNHYLSVSERSTVFDPTFCGDPSSSTVHTDVSQVIPAFSIHQSNLPITNYNYQFHSFNPDEGNDSVINEMESMKLPSGSTNTTSVSALEVMSHGSSKTASSNGASNKTSVEYSYNNKKCENKQGPLLRTIAVQVHRESLCNTKINTDPFQPFENQQGDILRIEKEHNVLQLKLQEAEEKYDQLANRSKNEITALEEKMSEFIQKNKLLKSELDSVRQFLESEIKKSQHEKRENNEILKKLKSEVKSLAELNQMYTQNIQEKEQLYEKCFKEFEEISDQLSKERKKVEEAIQKNVDMYHETSKRASEAEVAVLESQQKAQLFPHYRAAEDTKCTLEKLKALNASIPAMDLPHLQMSIAAWEHFLFQIEQQSHQTGMRFKDQIMQVRAGMQLSSLPSVTIPSLPVPPSSGVMMEKSPIDDPAIIASCPLAATQALGSHMQKHGPPIPHLPSVTRATKEKTTTPSSFQNQASSNHFRPGTALTKSQSTWSPASSRSESPVGSELASYHETQPSTSQSAHPKFQQPKNSFDKIIKRLLAMFPNYTHTGLTHFIKEVRSANGGSLAGLLYDEIINQVADRILDHQDHQDQKKFQVQFPSASPQQATFLTDQRSTSATSEVPKTDSASRKIRAPDGLSQPWQSVNTWTASQWQGSNTTTFDDEPCIICHDDLTPDSMCVLQCRHHFHEACIKQWLKANSTCPTCRVHALHPEDFPLLPGMLTTQTNR
ncbi:E3 ubiquitin-protein ligase TTC3 [Pristis pectinata]|uniref:E3 ubiquitin-protein ligase TTC3 n=1 Tax=Pristis pectinata TaxID=685728 RepID=UPI00223E576C|nr:E3 ubiquitin-protein ligase TTC3 [Pristis pectinata]